MDADDRRLLLTAAWIFARHGQGARARVLCEALVEDKPNDGVSAAALAERMLDDGDASAALSVLARVAFPRDLDRVSACLETRALRMLGRVDEAARRWKRHLAERKKGRKWVVGE